MANAAVVAELLSFTLAMFLAFKQLSKAEQTFY